MNTTWRDIDFANQTVDVSPKKDRQDVWEWHIKDTDRRTLPLTDELVKLVAEHQASQPEGCPYVFIPVSRYEHIQERRKAGNHWQRVSSTIFCLGRFGTRLKS